MECIQQIHKAVSRAGWRPRGGPRLLFANVAEFGEITGEDTQLARLVPEDRKRRAFFKGLGQRHRIMISIRTTTQPPKSCLPRPWPVCTAEEADCFRGHVLTRADSHPSRLKAFTAPSSAWSLGFDILAPTTLTAQPMLDAVGFLGLTIIPI